MGVASSCHRQSNPGFVDKDDKSIIKEGRFQWKEVRLDTWNQLQLASHHGLKYFF